MKAVGIIYLTITALAIILLFYPVRHLVAVRIASRKNRPKPSRWLLLGWLAYFLTLVNYFVPAFLGMTYESVASEAKTELGSIYQSQLQYRRKTGSFAGGQKAFELLGWKPIGENGYSYFCGNDKIPNRKYNELKIPPGPGWPYPEQPVTTPNGFTCMAIGNVDADPFLDVWSISETGALHHLYHDRDHIREGERDMEKVRFRIFAVVAVLFMAAIFADEVRRKRTRRA
jgi:hypothetical protein